MWNTAVLWYFDNLQSITIGAFIVAALTCWFKQIFISKISHDEIKAQDIVTAGLHTTVIITGIALTIVAFDTSLINRINNLHFYVGIAGFILFFIGISGVITSFCQRAKP